MIITLKINNETYNVLQCRYVFSRKVDSKGMPRGGMKGGDIYVTMESTRNNLLFEEFVRKDGPRTVSGSLNFFDTHKEASIRTIEFEEAYVYALGEHMAHYSHLPMTQALAISPLRLDINGTVRMDRRFPQTYAFWWDEYKPEAEAIPVKVWNRTTTSKIASVGLLEGDKEITGQNEVVQYVNIQNNPGKHVDGRVVTHTDRLGQKLRCKIKFEKEGTYPFKVKLQPDSGNSSYSQSEKERHKNFEYCMEEKEFTTNGNGEKIIELSDNLFVSPAGGDLFSIVATDEDGNTVTAKTKVKTRRLLYYVEAKMRGLENIADDLGVFETEYMKHGILFKKLPAVQVDRIGNIGTEEERDRYARSVMEATRAIAEEKKTDFVVIGYTEQLAIKEPEMEVKAHVVTGYEFGDIKVLIMDFDDNIKFLWHGMDDDGWFVDCYFVAKGDEDDIGKRIKIPREACTPLKSQNPHPEGRYYQVSIKEDVIPKKKGKIYLTVNWVDRPRVGVSMGETNIAAICTKSLWQDKTNSQQNAAIIHEVAHQLRMVSDGGWILPDRHDFHYTGKGHSGNHCHYGLPSLASYGGIPSGDCVMFGSNDGGSEFCPECAKVLKKIDLIFGVV